MIRLIATDLDDTLLDAHSDVTARTVSAVRRAMDAGALFSLSSGRMPEAMLPLAEKLNVNAPMILYNGALIYDHRTGRTLFSNAIPAETALAVVIQGPGARDIAERAAQKGIRVFPVGEDLLRLGFAGIPLDRISRGMEELARVMADRP